jgi:D-alanyl-D-alanine dipeptidase
MINRICLLRNAVTAALLDTNRAAELLRFRLLAGEAAADHCVPGTPPGLVDVRTVCERLVILDAPAWNRWDTRFLVIPAVASRLREAARGLPENLRLGFWEGYRPISVQRSLWRKGLDWLRELLPDEHEAALELRLQAWIAHPEGDSPPHSTGTAVDVAPVDAYGRVLGTGDPWGALAVGLMARSLSEAGLVNYSPEWWHWSYGDRVWAEAYDCAPLLLPGAPEFAGPGDGI